MQVLSYKKNNKSMNTSNCFKIKVLEDNKPGADCTLSHSIKMQPLIY